MSRPRISPVRSHNGSIPIYLDTGSRRERLEPKEHSEYICPTCETDSREHPIHCISITSPSPPSYDSIVTPTPSSRNLAVPVLNLQTRHHSPPPQRRPQPPRPALQFDPEGRPHVRFRRNAFSPLSPGVQKGDIDWSRKSYQGLGIPDAPFRPDSSPITPGTAENGGEGRTEERDENLQGASNFAQRIEQKLWKYSASRNVVKRWLLEIISWSLSATCMAGIVIMLIVYKDKRIPKWPLGVTLNAYISVLSKVASAALLLPVSEALGQLKWSWFQGDNSKKMWDFEIFDNASRGPWGSILLLVRTKGRSLAALGAAVTLFALALDPFFQQVVEYPEHWRIQEGTGSIPVAIGYERFKSGREYRDGLEWMVVDPDMQGVVNHFFYDNGTLPTTFGKGVRAEVPLACPNSNCTWPEYETFGVCNQCEEASDLLEFKCLNTTLDWIQIPGVDNETNMATFANGTACGWYLKAEDPLLMTGYNIDVDTPYSGEVLLERTQAIYDVVSRKQLAGYPAKLNNTRNPLAHAIIASGVSLEEVQRNATPKAHECIISWCTKRMLSTYSEGGYIENVTNTSGNDTVESSPWVVDENFGDDGKLISTDYYYYEDVIVKGKTGSAYRVDNYTHVLTSALFDDIFPSTFTLANSTNMTDAMLRYKQYISIGVRTRNVTHNPFLYENITAHLDNLAVAMTNLIRASPTGIEMVTGPAYDKESFVDVRWIWLALPLGLLALTFIFLISTIIRSSIEQDYVGVWKTSAIATLLYGLPDEMQKKIATSKDHGTPRAKAKELRVKWLPRSGWRFSGSDTSPVSSKARHSSQPTNWI